MKHGLVLEGGALRGLYSMGIVDVLMDEGIVFDGAVGVSAGAALGCNIKSGQVGRALRYNMRFAKDWRYCSVRSLFLTGDLYGAEYAYHKVPKEMDLFDIEAFNANGLPFWAVCTDVETGEAVYHLLDKANDETYEWIRASASMPLCSRIVEVGGHKLLDGGVADSIPLAFMEGKGFERNLVILTQPDGYVKQPNRFLPLMKMSSLRHYPLFLQAVAQRHVMYNAELEFVHKREAEGRVLVFRPDASLPIKHTSHDPKVMRRVYELGREQALLRLNEVKAFLTDEGR